MNTYKSMKNKAKNEVSKAMEKKANEKLNEQRNYQNWQYKLVRALKLDSNKVEGGRHKTSEIKFLQTM